MVTAVSVAKSLSTARPMEVAFGLSASKDAAASRSWRLTTGQLVSAKAVQALGKSLGRIVSSASTRSAN